MPSTYTLNNGIELIGTGEQSGTWGDTTNTNFELIDTALDGQVSVTLASAGTSGAPNTLPISDGSASNGRNRLVIFNDGGDLGATAYVQLTPNDAEKIVYVRNDLSGSRSIILFQGTYNASNDYEVPAGTTAVVYFDGAGAGAVAANVFNNAYFDSLRLGSVSVTAILDEDNMASDSATALATQQSIKAYVDAQVTAQDLDFAGDSGTGAVDLDSQAFTIAGTANQITTAASAQTVTVSLPATIATTTADLTNLEVTNIKAKDGTASATIADSTGVMTIASSVLTTADINGGTIDNAAIGSATPSTGAFTTVTATGNITSQGQVITDTINEQTATSGVTVDGVLLKDGGATFSSTTRVDASEFLVTSVAGATTSKISFDIDTGNSVARIRSSLNGGGTQYPLGFFIASNEAMRIDTSQRVLIGTTTARSNFNNGSTTPGGLQIEGTVLDSQASITANRNDVGGPLWYFGKTRGTTVGSDTVVQDDDQLGGVVWQGSDGTDLVSAAEIRAYVDGTPGSNDMPGRIVFSTTLDGGISPTERMRITSAGLVGINEPDPQTRLHISSNNGGSTIRLEDDDDTAETGSILGTLEFYGNDTGGAGAGVKGRIWMTHASTAGDAYMQFSTGNSSANDVTAMTLDTAQRVLIGHTSSIQIGAQEAALQVVGSGAGESSYSAVRYTNTANSSKLTLGKSRAGSIGSNVIVQENDNIGLIDFAADDGTNLEHQVASIQAQVDGVPGANDLPGRLLFLTTADGANSVTERMRISSTGTVTINTPTSGTALEVNIIDNTADGFVVQQGSNKYISVDTTNTDEEVILGNDTTNPTVIVKGTNLNINSSYIDFSGSVSTPNTAAAIYRPADNTLAFSTVNAEAVRIDSSQRILFGDNQSQGLNRKLQSVGTTGTAMNFEFIRFSNDTGSGAVELTKSRGTSLGAIGIVSDGDALGQLNFRGDDGVDINTVAAQIKTEVDGTPGANDMPGRLVFMTTADGGNTATERMRIDSSGNVTIGNTALGDTKLFISQGLSGSTIEPYITLESDTASGGEANGTAIDFFPGGSKNSLPNRYARIAGIETSASGGNTGLVFYTTSNDNAPEEAMRIDSSKKVLIGTDSSFGVASSVTGELQIASSGSSVGLSVSRFASGSGAILALGASGASSVGTFTSVSDDHDLGEIRFAGADGTDMESYAARILAQVDGTPGSGDMPGRLVFSTTADGSSSPTERMRIDSSGNVLIATTTQNFSRLNFPQDQYIGFQSGNATVGGLRFEDNGGNGSAEIRFQGVGANQAAEIVFYTGDTNGGENMSERVRITDNGITFNGDTGAANALNDYEEGTWTPTAIGTTSGSATLSEASGSYTKIGRMVTVHAEVDVSAVDTATGNVRFGGLPFTVANLLTPTGIEANGAVGYWIGFATGVNSLSVTAVDSSVYLDLFGLTSSTVANNSNITWANMSTGEVRFSITYFTT